MTEEYMGCKIIRGEPILPRAGQRHDPVYPSYLMGQDEKGEWAQIAFYPKTPDAMPDTNNEELAAFLASVRPTNQHMIVG